MEKERIIKALDVLKEHKRKFSQSYDLIVTLKDMDVKTQPVDTFVVLPNWRGNKIKVCALVGQELGDQAEKACELVIRDKDFLLYKEDKKKPKQLAREYDFFIAQANLMAQIASIFGRNLGPRGKMPNPKAGCVIPPNANVAAVVERLKKTVQVKTRNQPVIQCIVGNEQMPNEQVVENILTVINTLVKMLPNEEHNLRAVYLKKTMSNVVKV